jgi:excisionase family DNA binding protein
MRGFGDYHRTLTAEHGDPRMAELFGHLRRAFDTFEQIMLRAHVLETKPQPQASPEKPKSEIAKPEIPPKMAYRVKEVRNLLGISNSTFYNMVRQGDLKVVKMGKMTLVLAKDLNEWLEKLSPQSRRPTPMPRRTR